MDKTRWLLKSTQYSNESWVQKILSSGWDLREQAFGAHFTDYSLGTRIPNSGIMIPCLDFFLVLSRNKTYWMVSWSTRFVFDAIKTNRWYVKGLLHLKAVIFHHHIIWHTCGNIMNKKWNVITKTFIHNH